MRERCSRPVTKKHYISLAIIFLIVLFFNFYPLNYYVMKPGNAYDVSEFIEVDGADATDKGSFSLMTVAVGKATPFTYAIAKVSKYQEILNLDSVRQKDEDDKEYEIRQLKLMSDSQFNALYVAFSRANLSYTITYHGVYVLNVLEGSAAAGSMRAGDIVTELNGQRIERKDDLMNLLAGKSLNDEVEVVINRDGKLLTKTLVLKEIPGSKGQIGLGITFAESKRIVTDPDVRTNTEDIGGPSAGLMMTLEILNQLVDGDLTKGYTIAGTGEMLEDGSVGRIGGIEKKVVAADKAGMEVFFAPDDEITKEMLKDYPDIVSNYDAAVKAAKEIGTTMKIVPVKTIDDALDYLKTLEEK